MPNGIPTHFRHGSDSTKKGRLVASPVFGSKKHLSGNKYDYQKENPHGSD